ncbi:MAG: MFS transporter, partial [Pseudomonadota bacterium]
MAKPNSISSPTWGDVLTGERGRRLLALLSIIVLHAGGNYMTVTMAASMIAELGDGALVGALTALYNIATILAAAATGILGDRFGLTRWLWMMALAFAGGALLSAIAPTMSLVALGRALSGLGGGGLFALAFIALRHHSSTAAWPKIIAFSGVFWIGAAFTGPLLGGVLADSLGWRGAFLLSGLFALGYAVMCRNAIASAGRQSQADQPAARERFPVWRLVGFGLGVAAISFAPLVSHPVAMVASTVIGFAAILYAAMRDRARPPRLFPRNAFRLGTDQGRALLAKLVLASGSMSILVFGPLVLASVHGYSNTFAGGFILLETVAWSFA